MLSESIITETTWRCYLCGRTGKMEEHHVFFGTANRKLSEAYGLVVPLCPDCHRNGSMAVHRCRETDLRLKRAGQRAFEKTHSREQWMEIFGRNYL